MKIKNLSFIGILMILMLVVFCSCQTQEKTIVEMPENALNLESDLVELIMQVALDGVDGNEFISCLDFVYPISISLYNMETEQIDTIVFNNDQELYLFFSNMNEYDLVTIDYPINVIVNNADIEEVTTDEQLAAFISECEEINPTTLTEILLTDVWFVDFYFEMEVDQTQEFCEFKLTFDESGIVQATNGIETYYGEWLIEYVDDEITVNFAFTNSILFEQINDTWFVINANQDVVGFQIYRNNGVVDVLVIDRVNDGC